MEVLVEESKCAVVTRVVYVGVVIDFSHNTTEADFTYSV